MISFEVGMPTDFKVDVHTSNNRGFTPEELAQRCADKIVSISSSVDDPIVKEQAEAFKAQIAVYVTHFIKQAVQSDRTTVSNALKQAGHPKLADHIRRL
tara:strand:+ start:1571 stop:1867 length:297 start_codon:yes stop_codon:yes gene_type:complete